MHLELAKFRITTPQPGTGRTLNTPFIDHQTMHSLSVVDKCRSTSDISVATEAYISIWSSPGAFARRGLVQFWRIGRTDLAVEHITWF
jgi:hypothetical protein